MVEDKNFRGKSKAKVFFPLKLPFKLVLNQLTLQVQRGGCKNTIDRMLESNGFSIKLGIR
ncbi:MAG: hypothetical protein EA409_02050 [Saprospirales bacterium]|nr:MAG: hypothetical protein EA409_02050 [Saprospirales bacterium]